MTTTGALDQEQNDSCVDPNGLIVKVVGQKGCRDRPDVVIGWIGVVSHYLDAIKLIVLCAFICTTRQFDAQSSGDSTIQLGICLTCLLGKM